MMRDLNEAVLDYPFDKELKQVVTGFAGLLKGIVQTIDRWGLKRRFLGKHLTSVDRFYRQISKAAHQSEAAVKWKERLEKNRDKLFTFLAHDGFPGTITTPSTQSRPLRDCVVSLGGCRRQKELNMT